MSKLQVVKELNDMLAHTERSHNEVRDKIANSPDNHPLRESRTNDANFLNGRMSGLRSAISLLGNGIGEAG